MHANSLDWITKTVDDMKLRRKGMDKNIEISDPFIYNRKKTPKAKVTVKKEKKIVKKTSIKPKEITPLTLQALLNNRAKISGKWYKKGDRIRGLKLLHFSQNSVTLKSASKEDRLILKKKTNKIRLIKLRN